MYELAEESKARIIFEIEQIDRLLQTYADLLKRLRQHEPDLVEVTAAASILHSFYNGLENIFLVIVGEIDREIPFFSPLAPKRRFRKGRRHVCRPIRLEEKTMEADVTEMIVRLREHMPLLAETYHVRGLEICGAYACGQQRARLVHGYFGVEFDVL
ncbi:MAG: hypothetical protein ACP5OO_06565 [Chloroflexia bacterium]